MLENKQAIIFDMDGVLIDSEIQYLKKFHRFLEEEGVHVGLSALHPLIGVDWVRHYQILESLYHYEKTAEQIRHDFAAWDQTLPEPDYREWLFADVHDTLASLQEKGYRLGLASNSRQDHVDEVLRQCDLRHLFEYALSSEQCKAGKPDPAVYLKVMSLLEVEAASCIVVEDSQTGIQAGRAAGAEVIAIKDTRFNIDQSQAHHHIQVLAELLQ